MTDRHEIRPEAIGDRDVQRVLARAIELEGSDSTRLTLEQFRRMGAEVGVGAAAIDRAFAEHIEAERIETMRRNTDAVGRRRSRRWLIVSSAVFGLFASAAVFLEATGFGDEDAVRAFLFALGIAVPLILAFTVPAGDTVERDTDDRG